MRRTVLITGAEGLVGGVLRQRLADTYDLRSIMRQSVAFESWLGDIADFDRIRSAFVGADAVVHLAAASGVTADWESVLRDNIVGTRNVFEAARLAGVAKMVFASSHHVVGGYEVEDGAPLYALEDRRVYSESIEVRPDSLYGVSKVFGEALGRMYADQYGMQVVCLRLGTVLEGDDPRSARIPELIRWPALAPQDRFRRVRATWLSQRDCARLVACAIDADVRWAVVDGVSDNPRRFWSLNAARDLLGFEPSDTAPMDD